MNLRRKAQVLICLTSGWSAGAQVTLPLLFDPNWDPGLDVLLGPVHAQVGLSRAGLSLGFERAKRAHAVRRALKLDLGPLKVNTGSSGSGSSSSGSQTGTKRQGASTIEAQDIFTDNAWYANITLGTPPQTIEVVLDSGSTDAFFFDTSCSSCQLNNHTAFDAAHSSSFVNGTSSGFADASFFDSTTLSGYTAKDTVRLGGDVQVKTQLLGLVTRRSGSPGSSAYSGIVGLGRNGGSFFNQSSSVFGSACLEKLLDAPLFGVALVKADQDGNGGGGEYNFGKVNQRFIAGDVVYANTSTKNAWGIPLDDFTANGKSLFTSNDYRRALVDTGATLIKTSDAAATALHALIPGAYYINETQSWVLPCNTSVANGAPNIFFSISGVNFGVPAEDLAFQSSIRGQNATCLSGVQGGSDLFTGLGDIFIKNHYIVFDYQSLNIESVTPRIGFANRTDIAPIL